MGSMRDDINAALAGVDEEETVQDNEQALNGVEPMEAEAEQPEDTTLEAAAPEGDNEGGQADKQLSSAEVAADPASPDTSNNSLKAPVDWSPKERELWSKIPRNLQERITNREKSMAETMAGTKEARMVQDAVNNVSQQFGSVLAADGFRNPVEAMQAAFGSMAALRMGTAEQKAKEVARLVSQYGVDINALDNALAGTPGQPQQNPSNDIDRLLQERLAPMQQFMQQFQNQQVTQQQQVKQQADNAVAEFANTAEFLNDVREDMADILTTAAKRGVNLSLQQAYDRACAAHPDISEVVMQRKQQEAITGGQRVLHGKQHAASSITGNRGGSGGAPTNASIRGSVEAAWDQVVEGG